MILGRVVVTGANGFIGSHLCRRLVESSKEVTACIRAQADASLLAAIPGHLRIHRIPSVGGDADLARIFLSADAVIHLAGRAHVMRETVAAPLDEFRKVNVGGTANLASLAAQQGVKRFIYMSSIKVNGEATNGHPFRADDPPGFSDPYGQSKWEAEERLRQIAAGTTMQWVVVRPPLVYGPGVRGNFLTLLRAVFRGFPLPLGSLHNRRSLVSVFNLSDFVCLLLDHPAAANSRFLVSDQHDLSTPDLLRSIAQALHRPSRILPCPEAALHVAAAVLGRRSATQRLCSSLVVDTQKATDSLCWSAPTTLSWGLSRTAEWFLTRVTQ
jgi:UDP-N-acetyl-alpha-D-quinovosamine dehydrogenase